MTAKDRYLEAIKALDNAKLDFYKAREAMVKADEEHYFATIAMVKERDAK